MAVCTGSNTLTHLPQQVTRRTPSANSGHPAIHSMRAVSFLYWQAPSPRSEPEWVFASSQPAIADNILGIERRCFTASLLGACTRSGRERRAQAGIDVVIAEGLL